jgi:hypothetical protein
MHAKRKSETDRSQMLIITTRVNMSLETLNEIMSKDREGQEGYC